jgi:hypothetical protein
MNGMRVFGLVLFGDGEMFPWDLLIFGDRKLALAGPDLGGRKRRLAELEEAVARSFHILQLQEKEYTERLSIIITSSILQSEILIPSTRFKTMQFGRIAADIAWR